jgi:hypothetical protein
MGTAVTSELTSGHSSAVGSKPRLSRPGKREALATNGDYHALQACLGRATLTSGLQLSAVTVELALENSVRREPFQLSQR